MSLIWKASEALFSFSFTCQLLLLFLTAVSSGGAEAVLLNVLLKIGIFFSFLNALLFFFAHRSLC